MLERTGTLSSEGTQGGEEGHMQRERGEYVGEKRHRVERRVHGREKRHMKEGTYSTESFK
ncbi:hypothetical protein DPMN_051789 [Dreissena polymorpha]|uniref:Uncharacterized protein n=1 Tax=Dreissena polymorpha TaxID=45954 RepID=A0A9D4HPA3_DREPO|nr:hypothetical protein DPMN_051789 [Dreissena polymorpha]